MISPHDMVYAECLLERWGAWWDRHIEDSGLPQTFNVWSEGRGAGGHRILCANMPARIQQVNLLVLKFPALIQQAAWAKFVFVQNVDGQYISDAVKAQLLGLPCPTFRKQVTAAKKLVLAGLRGGLDITQQKKVAFRHTAEYSLIERVLLD